jgi:PAS domain S-box-containing protein
MTLQLTESIPQSDIADLQVDREALIRRISWTIHNSLNSEEVLQNVVNELGKSLGVCRCRLGLIGDPLAEQITITHQYTAPCCAARPPLATAVQVRDNPALKVLLASHEPIAVDDVSQVNNLVHHIEHYRMSEVRSAMGAAIWSGDKPIGLFSIHRCQLHHWTDDEIEIVKAITQQTAFAVRQAELYREASDAATRANLLNQIIGSIRRSLKIDDILQAAAEQICLALGASRVHFRKFVNGIGELVAGYATDSSITVPSNPVEITDPVISRILHTRQPLLLDDVVAFIEENREDPISDVLSHFITPSQSQIFQPIFVNDTFWGFWGISQTDRKRKWTKNEISLIATVTTQLEIAISHSQLFAEAEQSVKSESLIRQISQSINQANSLDEIYRVVALELGKFLNVDAVAISARDDEKETWNIQCAYSNGEAYKPVRRAFAVSSTMGFLDLLESDRIICNDVEKDPRAAALGPMLRPASIRAIMGNILSYKGRPKLSIVAVSKTTPHQWTHQEISLLRAAADQMLIGYERIKLFEYVWRGKMEWETTFDALADGLLIFDRSGILRRVNEAGILFEGTTAEQMLGRKCCELLQGIEAESCKVAEVLATGRSITFELVPETFGKPVVVTISPLTRRASESFDSNFPSSLQSENQEIQGAVCIVRDLSELRAAEAEARKQRNFLVKLIEHASDVIMAIAPDGRLIWFNERLVRLSGYSRTELAGRGYLHFIGGDEIEKVRDHFLAALKGEAQDLEFYILTKTGEERLIRVTYTPVFIEGEIGNVLLIGRDVTEEKLESERAAQAEKMRALGQLSAGVAHNFNNLLAAILGHAQLLKRSIHEERLSKQASIIERAALDGAEMVKRIQSFGNQQKDTGYEALDINRLIQESIVLTQTRWQSESQAHGLYYEVETDLQELPSVRGSASEIKEVFVNLILNAIDAMPSGGKLKITTSVQDGFAQAEFYDSGIGMNEEVMEHLFEPFFTTKGVSGTGLGLAVSYSTIERHGGTIHVESSPGRGTTFSILLPFQQRREFGHEWVENRLDGQNQQTLRLLVVDDDAMVCSVMVEMLKTLGHEVEKAESGIEAFKQLEQKPFDIIFTDLSMPDMDGLAVAREIRRRFERAKIVLLTGYGSPMEDSHQQDGIWNQVMTKPVRLDELHWTIQQLMRNGATP